MLIHDIIVSTHDVIIVGHRFYRNMWTITVFVRAYECNVFMMTIT